MKWTDAAKSFVLTKELSELLEKNGTMYKALLGLGAVATKNQLAAYQVVEKDEAITSLVSSIDAAITANGGYLTSNAVSVTDIIVAAYFYEYLSIFFPPPYAKEKFPSYAKWFTEIASSPAIFDSATKQNVVTGGKTRVGGQIDLRAASKKVSAMADVSIARAAAEKANRPEKVKEVPVKETPAPVVKEVQAAESQPESNLELPNKSEEERQALGFEALNSLGLEGKYTVHQHKAAFNVDDLNAAMDSLSLSGGRCKNLFVRAKKDGKLYLVVALADTNVNLDNLGKKLGYAKGNIRFADQNVLATNLGVAQGHVSPVALVNDKALAVNVILDSSLSTDPNQLLYFHPLSNTASVGVKFEDLLTFIANTGHKHQIVDFSS